MHPTPTPLRLAALGLALLGGGCFESAPSRCIADGPLLNPGFECAPGATGETPGWARLDLEPGEDTRLLVTGDPEGRSGDVAYLSATDHGWYAAGQPTAAPGLVGQVVRLRGRVRSSGEARAGIALYVEGRLDTPFLVGETPRAERAADTWHEVETYATVFDPRADHLRAVLWIEGLGEAWFDDLELVAATRDELTDFPPCTRALDCEGGGAVECRFGHCLPADLLLGELAPPDEALRLQALDSVWRYADERGPGFVAQPDLDWDDAYDHASAAARAAETVGQWTGALAWLIAELRDIHGKVAAYDACYNLDAAILGWGGDLACTTRTLDDRIVVYRARDDNPLGLQVGDELLGYDGRSWLELEAELFEHWDELAPCGTPFSSETSRRWGFAAAFLTNRYFFHETVDVRRAADGAVESLPLGPTFEYEGRLGCPDRPETIDLSSGGRDSVISTLIADEQVVYAYVRWMADSTTRAFEELLATYPDKPGMILDVRSNPGGIIAVGRPFWEALLDDGEMIVTSEMAQRNVFGSGGRDDMVMMGKDIMTGTDAYYGGKIAILTGPNSVSAADVTPWMLAHLDRVRRFGLPTSGSFSGYSTGAQNLAVDAGRYADFFSFSLPEFVIYEADSDVVLTGTDQEPEERVWLTVEGVAAGRDDVIDAALAWILSED